MSKHTLPLTFLVTVAVMFLALVSTAQSQPAFDAPFSYTGNLVGLRQHVEALLRTTL